jgi:hypothetical protein
VDARTSVTTFYPEFEAAAAGFTDAETQALVLGAPGSNALYETARVAHFNCTAADRAQIQALLGTSVNVAALRNAVRSAATNAAMWGRRSAAALDRTPRSSTVRGHFRQAFGTTPEFVPRWRPSNARWRDRGALTAIRLRNAATILQGGSIRYFCWGRPEYCNECTSSPPTYYACSSWGHHYVICLGEEFLRDWRAGRRVSMGSTLLHEALHIYFGNLIEHQERERYGNVNCYVRFALRANGQPLPTRIASRCPAP